jgi:translocation and assembly module TamA
MNGYPFPKIAHRDVVADFAANRVGVRFEVTPGPRALFGDTRVDGLERLDPEYVYELLPWKAGKPYDIRLIDKARRVLFDTNLFGVVEFDNPGKVDNRDRLPITVRLKERTRRTIRLGVEYTTDYGPGVNGSWTHRNLFGMGEKLTATAIFNSKIRTASIRFDKPMLFDKDNTFIAETAFNDETTDAYNARSVNVATILQRRFSKTFRAGGGVGFRYGRVKQLTNNQYSTYHLAYLPLTATQDTREDLLNPTQGYALSLSMAPYQDVVNGDTRFFRYLLSGSTYYNFNSGDKVVAAVRGYAYQLAGPLQGDIPLGGLSVLTFSLELRFKITESIGLVPFLDGGTAFLDSVPDFGSQDILYGAGLGLRYYTAIGPIRLDVATPINRRKGVDDSFQIYVSIGQSF